MAKHFKKEQSSMVLNAGTADSSGRKTKLDEHVSVTYNIGRFKDTNSFRVFENLSTDLLLRLDWICKVNPQVSDWKAGVERGGTWSNGGP